MKLRQDVRFAALELHFEELAEQVMVAVPLATIVEGRQEEVLMLDGFEQLGAVVAAGELRAQVRTELRHDRGAGQEAHHVGWLPGQHFCREVVGDLAPVAGGERLARAVAGAPGEHGEIRRRRPSLRGREKVVRRVLAALEAVQVEQASDLVAIEGEIVEPVGRQPVLRAQTA